MNPSCNKDVGAWGGAALVCVWFEIDVERSASGPVPGLFESEHLSVLLATVGINTCARDIAMRIDNDGTYVRIWLG